MKQTAAARSIFLNRFESPVIRMQFVMFLLAVLVLIPYNPVAAPVPHVDSGAFLTIGREILQGNIPYRDVWDHNAPLVHYINAAGLALGGDGRWGVWFIEVASLGAAAVMLFSLLRRYFGNLPAALAVLGFLANLGMMIEHGNLAEEYHLLFQMMVLSLLVVVLSRPRAPLLALVLGVCVGLSTSLKQNLIGVGITAAVFLLLSALFERRWARLLDLACMAAGAALVWAGWAVFFFAQNALPHFWDAAFLYNLYATRAGLFDRIEFLRGGFQLLYRVSGFFVLSMVTWLAAAPFLFITVDKFRAVITSRWLGWLILGTGVIVLFNGFWDDRAGRLFSFSALSAYRMVFIVIGLVSIIVALYLIGGWARRLGQKLARSEPSAPVSLVILPVSVAFFNLPLEFVLASLSGEKHLHSYIPLLPSLTILIAFLAWSLVAAGKEARDQKQVYIWLAVLALLTLGSGTAYSLHPAGVPNAQQISETAAHVREITQPGQPVLQWGSNTNLYFLADRPAPGRYLSMQPLFTAGYSTPERVQAFLDALRANPPELLIDTRQEDMFLIIPGEQNCSVLDTATGYEGALLAERDARFPAQKGQPLSYYPSEMRAVYRWLCERYEPETTFDPDPDAWRIYRLRAGED